MWKWNRKKRDEKRKQPVSREQLVKLSLNPRFIGVKLHRASCRACSQLAGHVFPFADAPALPLAGCDAPQCTCEYLGVVDPRKEGNRRSGEERRRYFRMGADRRGGKDRRSSSDRWAGYDR